jgi:hypothetical protein
MHGECYEGLQVTIHGMFRDGHLAASVKVKARARGRNIELLFAGTCAQT